MKTVELIVWAMGLGFLVGFIGAAIIDICF